MRRTHRLFLAPLLALTVGCVHRVQTSAPASPVAANPPPLTKVDRSIVFEPVIITASPQQVALSNLNDSELYAIGRAAMGGGDNAKAVLHFERLADFFPNSQYRPEVLFKAGTLLERMKDYAGALSRFLEAAKAYGDTPEGGEARFKAADQYYFLADYDHAIATLESLTFATYISGVRHAEADTKRAVCLIAEDRLDEAEKILRVVLDDLQNDLREDTRDGYLPSQAQFYLAEIFRQHFVLAKLDPNHRTQAELMEDLEYKAEMLLSAQGHYLRCIRVGHPEWATASGYRIGELYQNLYEQMTAAEPPPDLDSDQVNVYREELRNRVRVLVTKAIEAYEQTLAAAERVGATNPFVQQTREQLDKMKGLMLKDSATATEGAKPPPPPPTTKDPS